MSHPLLDRLRDPDPGVRRAACVEAGDDPGAILFAPALCEALGDDDPLVARAASRTLGDLGQRDPGVLALLDESLRATAPGRRRNAALVWARLEPPPIKLLPVLVEILEAGEPKLRWSAVRVLVEMGRREPEVLPVLLHLAADASRPAARPMAVQALRVLAPAEPETARVLLAALHDGDLALRRAVLTALAGLISPPPEVFAALRGVARDPDPASRSLAEAAVRALQAAEAAGRAYESR